MIKPMLAATAALTDIKYPIYASPKLDGVRGLIIDGVLHSRSLKQFPNQHVMDRFSKKAYNGLDGELILGSPTAKDVYRVTNGACARKTGTPDVKFHIFDYIDPSRGFERRQKEIELKNDNIVVVQQVLIKNETDLIAYEKLNLHFGYEGLILRAPDGAYKYGRSTVREQGMLKLKRFTDSEFLLLEVIEEMHNANEATKNELGRTARSSHKANMVPTGRMGSLRVKDIHNGVEFSIGTGFDDEDKNWFWKNRKKLESKFVGKYKHFEVGAKDLPRFPVYLGPRPAWDR